MFLLVHGKVKNEPQKGIDDITALLEKHGAKIAQIGKWDERKLAYEIKKQKRGTYVLTHFEAEPQAIDEMRRDVELSETISRVLVIGIETDFPPFMTASELDAAFGTREYRDRPAGRRPEGDRPPVRAAAETPAAPAENKPEGEG